MIVDIFLVSCAKHYAWLDYALRSIARFASGFRQCLVLVPDNDLSALFTTLAKFNDTFGIPIRVKSYEDWPSKGFLRHEHVIMTADECTDADFILHTDSDCLFVEPFSPEDYFVDGKPVLMHGSYHWLRTEIQANLDMWRETVQNAIGGQVTEEFMRRHPAVHPREVYPLAREAILRHTGKPAEAYIASCQESFPQGFCEFNTLGAVALRYLTDRYHWLDHEQLHKRDEWPNNKLVQFWSHQSPEIPQEPVYKRKPWRGTPAELLKIV